MKFGPRGPLILFALVLIWRVLLLAFTVQPIPANDAFGYDGGVVNYLQGGHYCNPSMAVVFPISGEQIYSTYPPLYQAALFLWMKVFGTSVVSAMALHLALFAAGGVLTIFIVRKFFPDHVNYAVVGALLFGVTFDDRPESLAYIFGLTSLSLAASQYAEERLSWRTSALIILLLLLCLYTSVIAGAYFFGIEFLVLAANPRWRRQIAVFIPFFGTAVIFALLTFSIAKLEPLWWAGFMESAREQSIMTTGFHLPQGPDILKLIRTVPVFFLALAALPLLAARRKDIFPEPPVWLALAAAIFVMGGALLILSLTLLPANYCYYTVFTQVILAAALLACLHQFLPGRERLLRLVLWLAVVLVSIRGIGISTWGAACAWHNSYQATQTILRAELAPFVASNQPAVLSSPFLYGAVRAGVQHPIHSDWYYDHAGMTSHSQFDGLVRLRPPRLILSQFDYYRDFESVLAELRQHPELVEVQIRDLAGVRTPDSIPAVRRFVQHISWAPVIVDLNWK